MYVFNRISDKSELNAPTYSQMTNNQIVFDSAEQAVFVKHYCAHKGHFLKYVILILDIDLDLGTKESVLLQTAKKKIIFGDFQFVRVDRKMDKMKSK